MKKSMVLILMMFLLLTIPTIASAYTAQDLWLFEVRVEQQSSPSLKQFMDGLVIGDTIFLPLVDITNLLKIKLETDNQNQVYSFIRPGDKQQVIINLITEEILVAEKIDSAKLVQINGKLLLSLQDLSRLTTAEYSFELAKLVISIRSEYLAGEQLDDQPAIPENGSEEQQEILAPATISNINYHFYGEWNRTENVVVINNPSENDDFQRKDEDWRFGLDLNMKGTIDEWRYYLGGGVRQEKDEEVGLELDQLKLVYDLDKAVFEVGKLSLQSEPELSLARSSYHGISLSSRLSPLLSSVNGNIITVTGNAPSGSEVILYLNGWKVGEQHIDDNELYLFKDLLLYYQERANELKIVIKKPDGRVEELFRYVAVSNSLLNKGEVNFLAQTGKQQEGEQNYFVNAVSYWGVTDQTSLGLSWYGEMNRINSAAELCYNSLRLNQRLDNNTIVKGVLYQNGEINNRDTGYKLNLEYQDSRSQTGIEYHHQAEQYTIPEEDRMKPGDHYKYYYIEDLSADTVFEGKYSHYRNPQDSEESYDLTVRKEKDNWAGSFGYLRENWTAEEENGHSNLWQGILSFLVTPDLELLAELGYEERWEVYLDQTLDLGLEGVYKVDRDTYLLGANFARDIDEEQTDSQYRIGWSHNWELEEGHLLRTNLGCQLNQTAGEEKVRVPLGVQYEYTLPNEAKLSVYYNGLWETGQSESLEHRIGISLDGAFNFFGGKPVSTPPLIFGNKVGIVSGIVFRDQNRNGQLDAGEETLADVPVKLGRKIEFTDDKGYFTFKQIAEGLQSIGFAYNLLPIELTPSIFEKEVKVTANGLTEVNLGLYTVGTVDGNLITINSEQSYALQGIKVTASPGSYTAFTDYKGYYFFDQLPEGEYEIAVDQTSLPDWAVLLDQQPRRVTITSQGEYINQVNFSLKVNQEMLQGQINNQLEEVEKIDVIRDEDGAGRPEENQQENDIQQFEKELQQITNQVMKLDLTDLSVMLNDQELKMDPAFFKDKQIWAPVRSLAKAFNARVYWNNDRKEIYLVNGAHRVLFNVKLGYVMLNGEQVELKHGQKLIDDYTYISLQDLKYLGLETKQIGDTVFIFPAGRE